MVFAEYQYSHHNPVMQNAKVDSRAWCLQETVLSPRVLLYGKTMMGWICDGMVLGENSDLSSFVTKTGIRLRQKGPTQTPTYITWTDIVENYSERHMTVERDKLPTLSGLASEYHRLTGHPHLAGLWKQDILFLLLWMVFPSISSPTRRPREYRGPSWSWVSLDDQVNYCPARGLFYEFVAQVKDISIQIAGSNLFGETKSGCISLLAPILKVQWHQKQ
jgi:hypothetical protein